MVTDAGALRGGTKPVSVSSMDDSAAGLSWQGLPAATLRAWHVDNVIGLVVASAVLGLVATVGHPVVAQPWIIPLAGLALGVALLESAVVLPRRHRSYRYGILPASVVVESGTFVRRQLVVPLHQILYVETHQGPVLRAYGLTRVQLGTIADPKSIGPLTPESAEALRRAVDGCRGLSDPEREP